MKKHRKSAFTFIEIIMVIVILGILFAWITPNFINSLKSGRDGRRKETVYNLKQALQAYYTEYQVFPIPPPPPASSLDWGNSFDGTNGEVYFEHLPENASGIEYYYDSDGTGFTLEACLERPSATDDSCTGLVSCGSGKCAHVTQQ